MNLLEVRQVKKQFGSNVVLNNLTFSLPQGRILGFVGKNGSSKTTTMKVTLGQERVDEVLI